MSNTIPIKAIIWDFGGVLLRTEDPGPRQQLVQRLGITQRELEYLVFAGDSSMQAQVGKLNHDQHWEIIRLHLNLPVEIMPEVISSFWAGDRLDTDLVNIIRHQRLHYRTALLSNAWSNLRSVLTSDFPIIDAFDYVVISAEVGLMKPDPKIFDLVLKKVGANPEEAVFIDDIRENIDAANRQGLNVIHFQSRAQALNELSQLIGDFSA
jgi:epoxide hydrolase-like predicted phosphatase